MKKLFTLSMGLLLAVFTFAQAPQQISYQAVIRDAGSDPIANSSINLRFTIREGSAGGALVYQEVHSVTTNDYGLVNLKVGTGGSQVGSMTVIEWELYSYYLEVEQDSGSGYVVMGTSQMLSVPYALYANEATTLHDNTLDGTGTSGDSLRIAQQGAVVGEALIWDGSTWTPGSACVTLDDAYDCSTDGAGRTITVDQGAVVLDAYDNTALEVISDTNYDGIQIQNVGNGDGLDVGASGNGDAVEIIHSGSGEGVEVIHSGTGEGIDVTHNGPGIGIEISKIAAGKSLVVYQNAPDNGITVMQSANGMAANFTQTALVTSACVAVNGLNSAAAINSNQYGTGDGIKSYIINPGNASEALDVSTDGTGKAAKISQTNAGSAANVLEVVNSGNGVVGEFNQTKATAPSPTIHAATSGVGSVAVFNQLNGTSGATGVAASNIGPGHVMKLDQLHTVTMSPALVVTHAGKGSAARFEAPNPMNAEPTIDVFNSGSGHAAKFHSVAFGNTEYAVNVVSSNTGGGLRVVGDNPMNETLSVFEHENAGRAAHFDQSTFASPITKEVVLISTTNTDATIPALKVTTPEPLQDFAAEFNGGIDVTGSLIVGNGSLLGGGATITGGVNVIGGFTDVETLVADAIVAGSITAGVKMFTIDHPLDPQNKTLHHACIESNEIMNLYSGNVVLDANGEATIELPVWFEALNTDCRYQLTCVGGFANVYVSRELDGNRFSIAGGTQGLKVSWQLTAIRHDKFALENPLQVERDKEVKQ